MDRRRKPPGGSGHSAERSRVLVADRAAAWAEVLTRLLDSALDVDAESHTLGRGDVPAGAADVVVLGDDEGPDIVGRVAAIRATRPACRILVLAHTSDRSRVRIMRQAGADRIVTREARSDEFISAVRSLLGGRSRAEAGWATGSPRNNAACAAGLTAAETRVLFLLAAGRSNEEIAASLGITVNTVRTHVQRVTGKLGADSRLRAVALARESGALDRPWVAEGLSS